MAEYEYKCVPVPRTMFTGKVGKDSHEDAVNAYNDLINNAAQGGWELDRVDTVTSYQKPGCIAGLFGRKDEEVNYKLLIFRRQKA